MAATVPQPEPMRTEAPALAADERDYDISDNRVIEALLDAENRHFWQRSRNRLIVSRLARLGLRPGSSFLDLGCGMGCVSQALSRASYAVTGVDGHQRLIDVAAGRSRSATFVCKDLRLGVGELAGDRFDAVGLFDVIEHLENPGAALAQALSCLRPGGLLVGTVPANMWLWSPIDDHSGHKIRYTPKTLRPLLQAVAGARFLELAPFNRSLVPMMWLQRRALSKRPRQAGMVENLKVPWSPLNAALYALVVLEQWLEPLLALTPLPGASLWFALERAQQP